MQKQKVNLKAIDAIELLVQGNARFINGLKSIETFISMTKCKELAKNGQMPFVIILTCSDSRIPIELIFDRGLGDLFVIRTFGNTVDRSVIASIEYALINFGCNLILILGHSRSGAIRYSLENETNTNTLSPALKTSVSKILPSIKRARIKEKYLDSSLKDPSKEEQLFQSASYYNALNSRNELIQNSEIITTLIDEKQLYIVPSIYQMDEGLIQFDLGHDLAASLHLKAIQTQIQTYGKTNDKIEKSSLLTRHFSQRSRTSRTRKY